MNRAPELPAGTVPAGASHFYHNPQHPHPSTFAWRKQVDGKWFMFKGDEWHPISGNSAHMFVPIAQVLQPEWDGTGLPPIGTVCEVPDGPDYQKATIIAHYGSRVVFAFDDEDGHPYVETCLPGECKPIRTAEQIAADERLHKVRNALSRIGRQVEPFNVEVDCSVAIRVTVEAMIDAGYTL